MGNILTSTQHDPYLNLAAEEYLLERANSPTLYLWINEPSVIVGKHQNFFKEVDLNFIAAKGIHAVRRTTGGGAVYHDLGNLNYSFIIPNSVYDVERQNRLLLSALKDAGVVAVFSGRNDVLYDGRKIGGQAYKKTASNGLHHGTLLIDLNVSDAASALTPPAVKLASKGVTSVRERIANIREFSPGATVESISALLAEAFGKEYGGADPIPFETEKYRALADKFASDEWIFGQEPPFSVGIPFVLNGESSELRLSLKGGTVRDARLTGDFIDPDLPEKILPFAIGKSVKELETLPETIKALFGKTE